MTYYVSLVRRDFNREGESMSRATLMPGDFLKLTPNYVTVGHMLHFIVAWGPRAGHRHWFNKRSDHIRPATPLEILASAAE